MADSDSSGKTVAQMREAGLITPAGNRCTHCRVTKADCRPCAVVDREHIPALCDECYRELDQAGRLDHERDREVFFPA